MNQYQRTIHGKLHMAFAIDPTTYLFTDGRIYKHIPFEAWEYEMSSQPVNGWESMPLMDLNILEAYIKNYFEISASKRARKIINKIRQHVA